MAPFEVLQVARCRHVVTRPMRPVIMQSERRIETRSKLFVGRIFLSPFIIVIRIGFFFRIIVFVLFLEAFAVREQGKQKPVFLPFRHRAFSSSHVRASRKGESVCHTRNPRPSRRRGRGVGLHREPPKLPRTANAAVGKSLSPPLAAAIGRRFTLHAACGRTLGCAMLTRGEQQLHTTASK